MRLIHDLPRPEYLTRMWRVQQLMGRAFWATVLAVVLAASCIPQQAAAQGLSEKQELCMFGAIGAVRVATARTLPFNTVDEFVEQNKAELATEPQHVRYVFTEAVRFGLANRGRDADTVGNSFYNTCLTWSFT